MIGAINSSPTAGQIYADMARGASQVPEVNRVTRRPAGDVDESRAAAGPGASAVESANATLSRAQEGGKGLLVDLYA